MFEANKIVISLNDKNRRFDGSQLFFRKALPLNAANLAVDLGPVIWIGCDSHVAFSLKLDVSGLRRGRMVIVRRSQGLRCSEEGQTLLSRSPHVLRARDSELR